MWILILIVLAVVVYFVMSQASSSNQSSKVSSRTQASKASSQNYANQVDYSNLEVSLESSVSTHYNYTRLRDLLAEGKWREADEETGRVMLNVGSVVAEKKIQDGEWTHSDPDSNRLGILHFLYFPCTDLCTIDRLWLKYSNGRFGFSIQNRIMSEIGKDALSILVSGGGGETLNKRLEISETFEKRIGWYTPVSDGGTYTKNYNDLTFAIQAPYGHLPSIHYSLYGGADTKSMMGCTNLAYILNRFSSCDIAL